MKLYADVFFKDEFGNIITHATFEEKEHMQYKGIDYTVHRFIIDFNVAVDSIAEKKIEEIGGRLE